MSSIDMIKKSIAHLYKTNPYIHINVTIAPPKAKKTKLFNQTAVIKGVYPNIFQIEETNSENPTQHTLQYTDVLTKNIEILELDDLV